MHTPSCPNQSIKRQRNLSQILLLVAHDELKFVSEGEVEGGIECCIFGLIDGTGATFRNWGQEAGAEGNDDKSVEGWW